MSAFIAHLSAQNMKANAPIYVSMEFGMSMKDSSPAIPKQHLET